MRPTQAGKLVSWSIALVASSSSRACAFMHMSLSSATRYSIAGQWVHGPGVRMHAHHGPIECQQRQVSWASSATARVCSCSSEP